jgi:glycosyltransferase involved in cell wall biosynthesis
MEVAMLDPSAFTPPYDHYLCSGLAAAGMTVRLLTTDGKFPDTSGSRAYRLDEHYYAHTNRLFDGASQERVRLGVKGLEHVYDTCRVLRKLRRLNPDVIHVQWLPLPVVDRLSLPALRRIAPTVFTVHDSNPFHGASSSRLQLLGTGSMLTAFDHLVVHTEFTKRELVADGVDDRRISTVPHGVLPYPPATNPVETEATNRILFFGTIKPYKGVEELLRAVADLPSDLLDETELYIAGRPEMPIEPLKETAREAGIDDHVTWDLRYVPDDDISALFDSADVIAFPYREIDQSGALMTALQFGKPVVATRVGGFPEVLDDGTHGRLVDQGDTAALSDAFAEILRNPARATTMGEAVESLAETTYSWDRIAARTISIYEQLQ